MCIYNNNNRELHMADELKIIFPGKDITVGSEIITIKPFKLGQYPKVLKIIADMAPVISASQGSILTMITAASEEIISLAMISTGKPRSWFDQVEGDEGLAMLTAVIEENWSFFEKKVKPELAKTMAAIQRLQGKAPETVMAGADSTLSSSVLDIPDQASTT
jgi:hypothetical protein